MAKDIFHTLVRELLEEEGWKITHDPFILKTGGLRMEIDLAAEQVIAANKDNQEIAVEIKSFLGKSKLNDFYEAKGQYDTYRRGLFNAGINRTLFLAIDEDIYASFFQKQIIKETITEEKIHLIVFNSNSKKIVTWLIH